MRYYTTAQLSENIHKTPEGFLICKDVRIARVGQMLYMEGETPLECDEDGQVLVEREEEEVFRPETMASFEGKPVTIGHPPDAVTPENWARVAVGILQNIRRDQDDLVADLLITVKEAIDRILGGLREVSCGYDAEYTQTKPGYGFQSKIIGNHVALVKEGRAGSAYAINDEKGKSVHTKIAEKAKAVLTKAMADIDALAALGSKPDGGKTGQEDKSGKTGKARTSDKKTADDDDSDDDDKKKKKSGQTEDDESAPSLADLASAIQALSAKVDTLTKSGTQDEDDSDDDEKKKRLQAQDDDDSNDDDSDIMGRLEKLEQAVAKLLAAKDDEDDTDVSEESEEFNDAKSQGGAVGSEDEMPKSTLTGDAAKFEVLAPGKKFSGKNAKAQALKAAYATDEGKAVIQRLTGKKGLTVDNAATVDLLFHAAAELLAQDRQETLSSSKRGQVTKDSAKEFKGPLTPEQINQINAEYYGAKH